jgi:hypothetical protein
MLFISIGGKAMNVQNVTPGTALEVLNSLETQWTEFRRKVAELAPRFEIVASENDLEAVFEELLELWQEYPLLWMLLNNQSDIGVSKLPPSPEKALKFNPKEIANKYYLLLVKLNATEPPQEETDDPRTDA